MHVGRHTAGAPHEQRRVTANLARAVATSLVRTTGPMRQALAFPNDGLLPISSDGSGDPWTPTTFRSPNATIGMA